MHCDAKGPATERHQRQTRHRDARAPSAPTIDVIREAPMSLASTVPSLVIEQVQLELLRPDPANPRRISEDELDALERSLRQFGFVQPVLARREDRTVIGGHQRLVAARRLGLTTVPVTWLDISSEQARLLGLALNKISGS
jgi:hypothetical protein